MIAESFMVGNGGSGGAEAAAAAAAVGGAGFGRSETMGIVANIVGCLLWCVVQYYWLVVTKRFATGRDTNFSDSLMKE